MSATKYGGVIMKRFYSKILASLLCIACLPAGLQTAAQEEQSKCQYVVLKVINKEDDTKPIGVTLLRIGDTSNHSFLKGRQGILSDTCIIQESDNDELLNNVCRSVEYGDIIEYRGNNLCSQTGTSYNYVGREENAVNDSFEKIGTVFDNPTSDVESKVVDGESVIAVHPADGSTYLIGRGATDNLFIELNCTAEEYNDETLAEEQETPIETLANELTLTEAYNKLDALLYPDGIGWRTLAPLDECLEMKCIIYYYFYYDTEACDRVRKICEENGIDTSLLMFCALESGEEPETPIETLLEGDADGSGKIDILDVITLNKAILGKEELSETQLKAIDFNGNGKPDSEEALTLMKYIVGLITSFTE